MINFIIGTAQFGQEYGIRNKTGAVEGQQASNITTLAIQNNIHFFDTAKLYGKSEKVLGSALENKEARIITKYYADENNPEALFDDFKNSLNYFKTETIEGVLIHNCASLLSDRGSDIWIALQKIQKDYSINKIGASVYTAEELIALCDKISPDIIQLPCNLLDQRFLSDDIQSLKKQHGIEFHARSLFLQGLLLTPLAEFPKKFVIHKNLFEKSIFYAQKNGLNQLQFCLAFARWAQDQNMIDRWVVGIDSPEQLSQIIESEKNLSQNLNIDFENFATKNLDIIDPRQWNK